MTKEFIIVYQDCPTCGARKEWGEKTIAAALNAHAIIRKVSFVTREGEALALKAIVNGITRYPFVTDGKTFAYDIKTLIEAESEPQTAKKETKKHQEKQKSKGRTPK